ncbi:hypothetical protein RFI_07369 [Reticulomyxa filosa]|uniref:Uncharacterized protein n=1 Tax=Reticulomyxa filosa TaxID=46433 RepID=X6NTX5_RETFI|nr:hypothetical protein RFI_07369 [Reticulomyxa filosa]|eukprot:ETO29750.1 hypothetical protein RFI_07369 [Reticulomyxa filosa]
MRKRYICKCNYFQLLKVAQIKVFPGQFLKNSISIYKIFAQMSLFKAYVNDGQKIYTILLSMLTIGHLKQQIVQVTQLTHEDDVLTAIIDENGINIKSDEDLTYAFKKNPLSLTAQFRSSFLILFL